MPPATEGHRARLRVAGAHYRDSFVHPTGAVLAVRAYCEQSDFRQVYFDMSRATSEIIGDAGYAMPHPADVVRSQRWADQAH
jgi:hypothetical protein